jgi:hypothetical protein
MIELFDATSRLSQEIEKKTLKANVDWHHIIQK